MRIALLTAALLLPAAQAAACGYCVEDKIAATYDHAVITTALSRGHQVVFFHVEGAPLERQALERAVSTVRGVDAGSVRISPDALTVSLAFDPRRLPMAQLQARLDRGLAARKASLLPLRVMDRPADLKTVKSGAPAS
jgi:hypothetical protein